MIYYLLNKDTREVKIGYTNDIRRRLASIKFYNPGQYHLIGVHAGMKSIESEIHEELEHLRVHGEFFHLCEELLCYIECMSDDWYLCKQPWIQSGKCDPAFYRQVRGYYCDFVSNETIPNIGTWIRDVIKVEVEEHPGWESRAQWYIETLIPPNSVYPVQIPLGI